jgi:Rrf2 family protein
MATNCRFAFAVHVLSVLALYPDEPMTSDLLAQSVNTNPVVVRRLLGELAEAGLVESQRGPGGGAKLAQAAQEITLLQVHHAVAGEVEPFGEHPHQPAQSCKVGRGIKRVLEDVASRAKAAVEREYAAISLAEVARQIEG